MMNIRFNSVVVNVFHIRKNRDIRKKGGLGGGRGINKGEKQRIWQHC